jgi:Zn-dependent M28 family amino/carboxypeptidase
MIGRRDEAHANTNNYVYVIGADRLSSDLDNITANANKSMFKWTGQIQWPYWSNHFYERSDHYNFAKNGVPSVFIFNESMLITIKKRIHQIKLNTTP